jgi:uncharacterized protein YkwD
MAFMPTLCYNRDVRKIERILFILLILLLIATPARAQEEDDRRAQFLELINEARLDAGLPPYALADELVASAQRHADDLAANTLDSHTGSDGSTAPQRIAEAGYEAWADGAMVGENFWIGFGSVETAFEWFMGDPPHRDNIISEIYREVGIGIASDAEGRFYNVIDFGTRPNVLPIFINEGADTANSEQVAVWLSNENAFPQGQGTLYIGQAIEVRVGDSRDFGDQPWEPWEELLPWILPAEPGEHTVYVQFRDGAGRTTISADSITLLSDTEAEPPPSTAIPSSPEPVTPTEVTEPPVEPTEVITGTPSAPGTTADDAPPSPTPAPTPVPLAEVTATPLAVQTPITPTGAPQTTAGRSSVLISALCGLQILAVLMGLIVALRRRPTE